MTVEKKLADMFACDRRQLCSRGCSIYKVEKEAKIGGIGDNGVVGKPSLSDKIVQENIQIMRKGIAAQGLCYGLQ